MLAELVPGCTKSADGLATIALPDLTCIDLSGQLLYPDGAFASGVPVEIRVMGQTYVGWTDAIGTIVIAKALTSESVHDLQLRLLDGFELGRGNNLESSGSRILTVPFDGMGRFETVYLQSEERAMVMVVAGPNASSEATTMLTRLDLLGSHGPGELLTHVRPPEMSRLRAMGFEVLVLDVDVNAYVAKTNAMDDNERAAYIDGRVAAARSELARMVQSKPNASGCNDKSSVRAREGR